MEVQTYNSFREAIESLAKEDWEYIFVRHSLEAGDEVKPHYHENANEWVVIDNGSFSVRIGEDTKALNLRDEVSVIHFPRGQIHSFSAESKVSYFVFRDRQDKTIYVGG